MSHQHRCNVFDVDSTLSQRCASSGKYCSRKRIKAIIRLRSCTLSRPLLLTHYYLNICHELFHHASRKGPLPALRDGYRSCIDWFCCCKLIITWQTGPSCSNLTMSLVNDSLKFTSSDTQICCNFLLKNVRSFCSAKATHIFSAKNIRILYIESAKTVNEITLNELVKLTTLWTTGPRLGPFHPLYSVGLSKLRRVCAIPWTIIAQAIYNSWRPSDKWKSPREMWQYFLPPHSSQSDYLIRVFDRNSHI